MEWLLWTMAGAIVASILGGSGRRWRKARKRARKRRKKAHAKYEKEVAKFRSARADLRAEIMARVAEELQRAEAEGDEARIACMRTFQEETRAYMACLLWGDEAQLMAMEWHPLTPVMFFLKGCSSKRRQAVERWEAAMAKRTSLPDSLEMTAWTYEDGAETARRMVTGKAAMDMAVEAMAGQLMGHRVERLVLSPLGMLLLTIPVVVTGFAFFAFGAAAVWNWLLEISPVAGQDAVEKFASATVIVFWVAAAAAAFVLFGLAVMIFRSDRDPAWLPALGLTALLGLGSVWGVLIGITDL